jgi:hypothetical protein
MPQNRLERPAGEKCPVAYEFPVMIFLIWQPRKSEEHLLLTLIFIAWLLWLVLVKGKHSVYLKPLKTIVMFKLITKKYVNKSFLMLGRIVK